MPSLVIILFTLSVFHITSWTIFGYAGILNLLAIGFRFKDFNRRNQHFGQAYSELRRMGDLLGKVQNEPFSTPLLTDLKNELFQDNQSACQQIGRLNKLLDALDNRNNIIVGVILNMLLLWDWQCLWRIEKWKSNHQLSFDKWTKSLAYIDGLNSLANLAYNNPEYSYPEVKTDEFVFDATQMGHPLINADTRICNDIKLDNTGRFAIVTRSQYGREKYFFTNRCRKSFIGTGRCPGLCHPDGFSSHSSIYQHAHRRFADEKRIVLFCRIKTASKYYYSD